MIETFRPQIETIVVQAEDDAVAAQKAATVMGKASAQASQFVPVGF
jgi:hypothetical protein